MLKSGADRARSIATPIMDEIKKLVGFRRLKVFNGSDAVPRVAVAAKS